MPPLNVVVPSLHVKFPPMFTFLATPRPPSRIALLVVAEVDCVVSSKVDHTRLRTCNLSVIVAIPDSNQDYLFANAPAMTPVPTESSAGYKRSIHSMHLVYQYLQFLQYIRSSWNSFELDPRSLAPSSSGNMSPPAK